MIDTGAHNRITDVPGIRVGNAEDHSVRSGVTVVLTERSAVAAADVRGGAPGTRETEALDPINLVGRVDAVVLAGGSVFGLDAAGSVTAALAGQGRGYAIGEARAPIVPAAILFDLLNGGDKRWGDDPPYRVLGRRALAAADRAFALGNAGAGYGARAGALKGGLGSASLVVDEFAVGALVAVNAAGSATLPDSPLLWAWPFERDRELGDQRRLLAQLPATLAPDYAFRTSPGCNTTLAVVATDAPLTRSQARRIAIMTHDGLARAIRPVHTPFDGDTVFVLSTAGQPDGLEPPALARLGMLAADCVTRAAARGVYEASSLGTLPAYRDVFTESLSI